ncbi:MAG: glycoside hydrolase family 15 protein [Phycisphaerae bacterium]|nr:glycoside hydrolase family 15 protein [Phycisphaerae bacterium]
MYRPIESYGLIGNMRTAALVGGDGSMDWLCLPHFDSPSVFAAILDDRKGGRFQITAVDKAIHSRQFYWPETNVLVTRFLCPDGVAELVDFMPVGGSSHSEGTLIVRTITGMSGELAVRVTCHPAFNYGRDAHEVVVTPRGVCFHAPGQSLGLATDIPLKRDGTGVSGEFRLAEGQSAVFVMQSVEQGGGCGLPFSEAQAKDQFHRTIAFWRRWLAHCSYTGRWREMVHRSALVLKLLTFEPTGAIVAAPTCSLPEALGGSRNWDYRYVWIRDAAFTVYALMRIGFREEATHFMQWVEDRCRQANPDGSLQLMYTIDGRPEMPESVLGHFEGYAGSHPVRIGNAAHEQLQIDMYGELMDSVYLYNKYGSPISYDLWQSLVKTLDWVCENWHRPDTGIWEFRGEPRHFVYSKLMSWVALDRGVRLADKRSFPADRQRWLQVRDMIYREIHDKGFSATTNAFVQTYGGEALDAANLIMPLVFFMSPTDPRMLGTIDAIRTPVRRGGLTSGGLVYRYHPAQEIDGLEGEEGTFNICSFWLIEALTRAGRTDPARLDEARLMFERMMSHANHLGLYAEQIGPCGEALGNYPQAFTHIALISAAFNLDRALDGRA